MSHEVWLLNREYIHMVQRPISGSVWHRPLIPALRRQTQADLCEFEASLVYRVSSRTARAAQRNPVSATTKSEVRHGDRYL